MKPGTRQRWANERGLSPPGRDLSPPQGRDLSPPRAPGPGSADPALPARPRSPEPSPARPSAAAPQELNFKANQIPIGHCILSQQSSFDTSLIQKGAFQTPFLSFLPATL